jgi:tetratricopeptide (TPR) repeat protein
LSRSEHATRRDRRDPGDLDRKRRIKGLIAAERNQPRAPMPPVSGDAVPIEIVDHGPFVHYPSSVEDLRNVMHRLPPGSLNGLSRIELRLAEPDDDPDRDDAEPADPFVGRLRHEVAPGVFSGRVLGRYFADGARIELFAYVYDPAVRDRVIIELYLRMKMLATFIHELGHHHDLSARVARGRWRADDPQEREIHAEAIEHAWTRDCVVPYLEEAYPAEVDELRCWLEQHGGVALPLDVLLGDPRTTLGVDGERLFFGVNSAFESLLEAVARGETAPATQIQLANELHYGLNYDEALAILVHVLERTPDHADALALRADIFVHQGRYDEAQAIARGLLARDPVDPEAWRVVRDVAEARGDWAAVLQAASRLGAPSDAHVWSSPADVSTVMRARIELADWAGAERQLEELRASATTQRRQRVVNVLACLLQLRQQRFAEAYALATTVLAEPRPHPDVRAVQIEAACQLGKPFDATPLPELCASLSSRGYAAWAARLTALAADAARAAPSP